jgi:8-oxo-dGTP pyrophosphatase MutT (NUDIX family)
MAPPRIKDPRAVPIVGHEVPSPPVADECLSAQALRDRFARPRAWVPEFQGDGHFGPERPPAAAAVLVPLVARSDGLQVLLTRRTDHLRDHAGQISFPGGRSEPEDGSPAATALREAHEEVGLVPSRVEVIGQLPTYTTVTRYVVTPVVGLVDAPFDLHGLMLDRGEVAEAFLVPLAFLMNPAHHQRHRYDHEGGSRFFLSMPWRHRDPAGDEREYFIWGATAAMLRNLYGFLSVG